MTPTQENQGATLGANTADNLIRVTDRLSRLMDQEVEMLRGSRARDIRALQGDKESLSAVYQHMMNDVQQNPAAFDGIDDGRREALKRSAARLEEAAAGNAIALRSAVEANRRLMEAIAQAIRENGIENAPYRRDGRLAHASQSAAQQPAHISYNQTL